MESDRQAWKDFLRCSAPPGIGGELWPDILKRLDAKSLGRFRCVCKAWNFLISSPSFVTLHHSLTSSVTPPHRKPYFRVNPEQSRYESYALCRPPPQDTLDFFFPFRLNTPCSTGSNSNIDFTFVDIVHGVICVSHCNGSSFDSTILWNPRIRKYMPLPSLLPPLHLDAPTSKFAHVEYFVEAALFACHGIGFGYDSLKKDFKVVRIWIPHAFLLSYCPSLSPSYEVYSAREGVWRSAMAGHNTMKDCQFELASVRSRNGCFMNGIIHWVVSTRDYPRDFVLMFDCEKEEFGTMEFPPEFYLPDGTLFHNPVIRVEVSEYAGMLSALVYRRGEEHIDFWVMEEYGLDSKWNKLYRIHDDLNFKGIDTCHHPLFGKLSLYGHEQWIFSSPCNRVLRFNEIIQQILSHRVYEESMFLLNDAKPHSSYSYTKEELVHVGLLHV